MLCIELPGGFVKTHVPRHHSQNFRFHQDRVWPEPLHSMPRCCRCVQTADWPHCRSIALKWSFLNLFSVLGYLPLSYVNELSFGERRWKELSFNEPRSSLVQAVDLLVQAYWILKISADYVLFTEHIFECILIQKYPFYLFYSILPT